MAPKTLVLCLLLVAAALPQGGSQHWSYGLSPGGKRDLDSLPDTLDNLVEAFPHVETHCSVLACAEESPFAKMYSTKGFLGSVTDRDNGHGTYTK
ncbi:progonadoliberin-1-like isoform X2 [Trematomus bernacchii]|uniref:progonadoliberin-1-like isoform X2 n=1 Tax=Trematomus bernacchii TaxID=40690 RepID=UPI00146D76B6|nr:progonadoliberin-1-like isoform X2 [Trematomus bernacchii]